MFSFCCVLSLLACNMQVKQQGDEAYRQTTYNLLKLLKDDKVDSAKASVLKSYQEKLTSVDEVRLLQNLLKEVNEIPDMDSYKFDSTNLLYNKTRSYEVKLYQDNVVDPDKFIGTIQIVFKDGVPAEVYDLSSIKRGMRIR